MRGLLLFKACSVVQKTPLQPSWKQLIISDPKWLYTVLGVGLFKHLQQYINEQLTETSFQKLFPQRGAWTGELKKITTKTDCSRSSDLKSILFQNFPSPTVKNLSNCFPLSTQLMVSSYYTGYLAYNIKYWNPTLQSEAKRCKYKLKALQNWSFKKGPSLCNL